MDVSLDGWDIQRFDDVEWAPWGSTGKARAKIIGVADGYMVALVEADPDTLAMPTSTQMPSSSTSSKDQ
ncbi:MAG: hypothetical protein WEA75_08820 [Acidimicrobiia bacterium]